MAVSMLSDRRAKEESMTWFAAESCAVNATGIPEPTPTFPQRAEQKLHRASAARARIGK